MPFLEDINDTLPFTSKAVGGETAGFWDATVAMWHDNNVQHSTIATANAFASNIDARNDKIFAATGMRLDNPYSTVDSFFDLELYFDDSPREDPMVTYRRELRDLADQFPDKRDIIRPDADFAAEAEAYAQAVRKNASDVIARSDGGVLASVGSFLGSTVSFAADPANFAAMLLMPEVQLAKVGLIGLLKVSGVEAAKWTGVEIAKAPIIQANRAALGFEYGWSHAAEDVAGAAVSMFGLEVVGRGLVRGGRRVFKGHWLPPEKGAKADSGDVASDAPTDLTAQVEKPPIDVEFTGTDLATPKSATPNEQTGRFEWGDQTPPATEAAASEAPVASAEVIAKAASEDPAVRGALAEAEIAAIFGPPPGVESGEHLDRLATAIMHSVDETNLPPGNAAVLEAVPATRAPLPESAAAGWRHDIEGKPVTFREFNPQEIHADPETFQFKSGGDDAGVTDRMKGVKVWDPLSAGKAIVYERANGELVIADGHQRLGLAKRLNTQRLDAFLFREADGWTPEDVRAYAAMKNLKELSGSPLDMARVMRARPDLIDGSLPLSDGKMREAVALSRLSPEAFDMVQAGVIPEGYAALIGDTVPNQSRHADLIRELVGMDLSNAQQARLALGQILAVPAKAETMLTLFGEETHLRSLLPERVKVLDGAIKALAADKRIFGTLEREAGRIEQGGNVLAHEGNQAKAEVAGQLKELIEKLATSRGVVSDLLNHAADSVANKGVKAKTAADAFARRVGDILEKDGINGLLRGGDELPRGHLVDDPLKVDIRGAEKPAADASGGKAAAQVEDQPSLFAYGAPQFTEAADRRLPELRAEIDAAISKWLPKDTKVEVRDRLTFGDLPESVRERLGLPDDFDLSKQFEGMHDPYTNTIWLSLAARNPASVLFEEAGHLLRRLGLLNEDDFGKLWREADRLGLREKFGTDERYRPLYEKRYADAPERLENAIREETVMEMLRRKMDGEKFGTVIDRIMKPIVDFIRAVRTALRIKGFRTVEDIFEDIRGGSLLRAIEQRQDAEAFRIGQLKRGANDNVQTPPRGPFADWSTGDIAGELGEHIDGWEDWDFKSLDPFTVRRLRGLNDAEKVVELQAAMAEAAARNIHIEALPDDMRVSIFDGGEWKAAGDIDDAAKETVSALFIDAKGNRTVPVAEFNRVFALAWEKRSALAHEMEIDFAAKEDALAKLAGDPMFSFQDAVNGAQAKGDITPSEAKSVMKLYNRLRAQTGSAAAAAQQLATQLQTAAILRRRRAKLQEGARQRVEQFMLSYRDAKGQPDPARALIAILEHNGQVKMPVGMSSVVGRANAVEALTMAKLEGLLHEFRAGFWLGRTHNRARLDNVVRECFGEATGDTASQQFAKAWMETAEELRQRFNGAGGDVGKLKNWGLPQKHDRRALTYAGLDRWRRYITPLLDRQRTVHSLTQQPMTDSELAASLEHIWKTITTDGWYEREASMQAHGLGSIASQHAEHRFLHFKDAKAWLAYQAEFGGGANPLRAMMDHVHGMAKEIGAMEVLGPNPAAMLGYMQQMVTKQAELKNAGMPAFFPTLTTIFGRKYASAGDWVRTADTLSYAKKALELSNNMWDMFRGHAGATVDKRLADAFQMVRDLNVASKLGSVLLTATSDVGLQMIARRFSGMKANGVWMDYLRAFKDPRAAVRAGAVLDSAMNILREDARLANAWRGPAFTAFLADRVMVWQGMEAFARAGKHSFGLGIMGELAARTHLDFAALPDALRNSFGRYGIDAATWDAMRLDVNGKPKDVDFLKPADLHAEMKTAGRASENIAERYAELITQETHYTQNINTLAVRSKVYGGSKRGTLIGEAWRSMTQFKVFFGWLMFLQGSRVMSEMASKGLLRGSGYAATLFATLTLTGAITQQLRDLAKGMDPRPMNTGKFWWGAIFEGGGLGIFGDFFHASENRAGGGIAETVAGPSAAVLSDALRVTWGQFAAWKAGEKSNTGRELVRFAKNNAPGSSLWYTRAAWDRMVLDTVQRHVDPEASQAFRNRVRARQKHFGNNFYWEPGHILPKRGPDISNLWAGARH